MGGKYGPFRILFFLASFISLFYGCATYIEPWPTPNVSHFIQNIPESELLWSLENIYTEQNDFNPRMVAGSGNLILLGNLNRNPSFNIICLNGLDGKIRWIEYEQKNEKLGSLYLITISTGGLYIGFGGFPEVDKYDFCSGQKLWTQKLSGRGIRHIYMEGNQVQVSTDPFIFTTLNTDNGEIIQRKKGEDIFVIMPDVAYLPSGPGDLNAVNTSSGELIWNIDLDRQLRLAPIFTDQIIFVRSGKVVGTAYAIDRLTGQVIWKTTDNIISNIAITSLGSLYVLTREGDLLEIQEKTGDASTVASFSNHPFGLNGEIIAGGYELAYDNSLNILFVLLGDSRQLFALQR